MIQLTEKAANKLQDFAKELGIDNLSIRVSIRGGGCAGYSFDLGFEEIISDLDETLEIDDFKVIIDPFSFQYMTDITIDYVNDDLGAGFKFIGGAIKASCGCGKSVSF